jgi:hypothetical protein
MKLLTTLLLLILFLSCTDHSSKNECSECGKNLNVKDESLQEAVLKSNQEEIAGISPDADLKKSVELIEQKYGSQWDFCDCVIKGDSLNKAIADPSVSEADLDKLLLRFEEIARKCQVFKIVDPNRTPKERERHEKKVEKCLKKAGII